MKFQLHISLITAVLIATQALPAQVGAPAAHIGYVYPSGGQAGKTVEVFLGGKGVTSVRGVVVSGEGVNAEYLDHFSNYKRRLQEQIRILKVKWSGKSTAKLEANRRFGPPPEYPMFTSLESLSKEEFTEVAAKFVKMESVQRNREIDQVTVVRLTIAADAKPGMRDIRLITAAGVTNPVRFMIDTVPEFLEHEPNDRSTPEEPAARPPFVMNGQVMPGDTDRFSFTASEGQQLQIEVKARALVPYLADAVPGWFQPVLTVADDSGAEIAYADDNHFSPDPVILFNVPADGRYQLSIRDSIYRGREDFVYRVTVSERPLPEPVFPLKGGSTGYPEILEAEAEAAPALAGLPMAVNGRIDQPGDVDNFPLRLAAGDKVKFVVHARRLLSPVDSLIRIIDGNENVLAWNDDPPSSNRLTDRTGLLTHNADSELLFEAPGDGIYSIQISDTQNQGGPEYSYRLEAFQPQPDFELYMIPSGIGVPSAGTGTITLHLKRLNGFEGPVRVYLVNPPKGFNLSGGLIPAGCDTVAMVVKAPFMPIGGYRRISLAGRARINGNSVVHPVVCAEEMTQAFITHHLVEADGLIVATTKRAGQLPEWKIRQRDPLNLTASGQIDLKVTPSGSTRNLERLQFELISAPEGVEMHADPSGSAVSLHFNSAPDLLNGKAGNLVVGVYTELPPPPQNKGKKGPRKVSLGVLPAIPYVIQ